MCLRSERLEGNLGGGGVSFLVRWGYLFLTQALLAVVSFKVVNLRFFNINKPYFFKANILSKVRPVASSSLYNKQARQRTTCLRYTGIHPRKALKCGDSTFA